MRRYGRMVLSYSACEYVSIDIHDYHYTCPFLNIRLIFSKQNISTKLHRSECFNKIPLVDQFSTILSRNKNAIYQDCENIKTTIGLVIELCNIPIFNGNLLGHKNTNF